MASKFDKVRSSIMEGIKSFLEKDGYEVLRTGSQEFCLPILNDEKDEAYLKISFVIPKGDRDGTPYNGYEVQEYYEMKQKEKAEKKAEADRKKAEKIARDAAAREAKKKAKEQKEG